MRVEEIGRVFGRKLSLGERVLVETAIEDLKRGDTIPDFGEAFFYKGYLFFIRKYNYRIYVCVSRGMPTLNGLLHLDFAEEDFDHDNWKEAIKWHRDYAIKMLDISKFKIE